MKGECALDMPRVDQTWVIRRKCPGERIDGAIGMRGAGGVRAAAVLDDGEVVVEQPDVGMSWREDRLLYFQCAHELSVSVVPATSGSVKRAERAACEGHLVMPLAVGGPEDGEGTTVDSFGFAEPAKVGQHRGPGSEIGSDRRMSAASRPLTKFDRAARVQLSAHQIAASVCEPAEVVFEAGQLG